MNKGRNIAIFLLCLICVSLLTFLTTLNRDNSSAVVDDVRYDHVSTLNEDKSYDFYFIRDDKMSGTLTTIVEKNENGDVTSTEYSLSIVNHPYKYKISGDKKKVAQIEYSVIDEDKAKEAGPYDLFTENMILSMIYGNKPILSVTQAIIVAFVAALGGIILGKAEDLWTYFNKNSEKEYPEYDDYKNFRVTGYCLLIAAVVLLLIFVIF